MSIPVMEDVEIPLDDPVPTTFEYACQGCGKELFYGGKGRHPKWCDDCKPSRNTATGTPRKKGGGANAALARQAADTLGLTNSLLATGMRLIPLPLRMPDTADALVAANEPFVELAYDALLADPALARAIVRGGGVSGKFMLIVAYAALAGAIVPVGIEEVKANRKGADVSDRAPVA